MLHNLFGLLVLSRTFLRQSDIQQIMIKINFMNMHAKTEAQFILTMMKKRKSVLTEISLAWLLTKVTAPVVGATKFSHVEGAAKAVELTLTQDEIDYLEELYIPHALAGVMAQNGKQKAGNVV